MAPKRAETSASTCSAAGRAEILNGVSLHLISLPLISLPYACLRLRLRLYLRLRLHLRLCPPFLSPSLCLNLCPTLYLCFSSDVGNITKN